MKTISFAVIIIVLCSSSHLAAVERSYEVAPAPKSDFRTELLVALEMQSDIARNLGRYDLAAKLDKSFEEVFVASEAELAPFSGTVEGFRHFNESLKNLSSMIEPMDETALPPLSQSKFAENTQATWSPPAVTQSSTGLPTLTPPPYFDGGAAGILCRLPDATAGIRNDTELVYLADAGVGTAKVAWAGMEVACGLDVLFIGTVGIGAAVCVAAALLVATSEEIVAAFKRCDETVDEAHLDAAFIRAKDNFVLGTHIHNDLGTHDANIDGDLATHDLKIATQLETHDEEIKAMLNNIMANQQEIIKLLKTPEGRRPGWNKEGY